MQRLVSKYGVAAHLALVAVAPLFLSPVATLWLAGLAFVWMVMEPSRVGGESLAAARRRSWSALVRDPLTWALLAVAAYAAVRWANGGVEMAYDAEAQQWSLARPTVAVLPGSAEGFGQAEFVGVLALLAVLAGCRTCLGKSARYAFLFSVALLSGVGAVTWAVMLACGAPLDQSLAACPLTKPAFAGPVFGLCLVASVSVLPAVMERRWYALLMLAIVSVGGNALGLFLFSPPFLAAGFAALAILALLYAVVSSYVMTGASAGLKVLVVAGLGLAATVGLALCAVPGDVMANKTAPYKAEKIGLEAFVPPSFVEARTALDIASETIWRDCPWQGRGLGSFRSALSFAAQPEDWEVFSSEQSAPLNGYWMLLVERGTVGAFAMALPLLLLLWTYFRRLVQSFGAGGPPATAVFGFFGLLAVLAEALVDVTALSPPMLIATALFLSVAAGSFPKEKSNG